MAGMAILPQLVLTIVSRVCHPEKVMLHFGIMVWAEGEAHTSPQKGQTDPGLCLGRHLTSKWVPTAGERGITPRCFSRSL